MVVWIEVALLENFLLDGVLLYLAMKCARLKVSRWRLPLAAAIGAAEAVVFPLLSVPTWAAYFLKALGGALLCVTAVGSKKIKPYLVTTAAFFFLTFALGGAMTAVYSFFDIGYAEGNGYLVEKAPVGLIVGSALVFAIAVSQGARALYRYRKVKSNLFSCTLRAGEREVNWQGYADSGNLLSFRGSPVCVVSPAAVFALFGRVVKETGRMRVGTVNGGKERPVFQCDSLTIHTEKQNVEREKVYLTVGDVGKDCQLILSAQLMEAS